MINKYLNQRDEYPCPREDVYTRFSFLRERVPLRSFNPLPPVRLPFRIPVFKAKRITSNIFACGCCGAWNALHYDY